MIVHVLFVVFMPVPVICVESLGLGILLWKEILHLVEHNIGLDEKLV